MNSDGFCCIMVAYVPIGGSEADKEFTAVGNQSGTMYLLSFHLKKKKSSLSIFNSSFFLGKAFVYFSACKICQNDSLGNRKPCFIHRTSITSPASFIPTFHQSASTQRQQIKLHTQHSTDLFFKFKN